MLELRPTCEHCNKPLPPQSLEARSCTYECNPATHAKFSAPIRTLPPEKR